jgi:hypothetical protein
MLSPDCGRGWGGGGRGRASFDLNSACHPVLSCHCPRLSSFFSVSTCLSSPVGFSFFTTDVLLFTFFKGSHHDF